MQELLACYVKDHRGTIMQIKEPVFPLIDSTKEVHTTKLPDPSTSITPDDVSAIFSEHVKFTRNMVGDEVAKSLAKFSQNSKYQSTTFVTTHPTATSSLATPSTSATQPPYAMPLNYFNGQIPLAHHTSMTLYTPELVPISSIPPISAIPGQASIVQPLAPMSAASNTATRVRYAAPHSPPTIV
jgi:hypothetical protein